MKTNEFSSEGMMEAPQSAAETAAIHAQYADNLAKCKATEAAGQVATIGQGLSNEERWGCGPWGQTRKERALGNRAWVEGQLLEEFTRLGQVGSDTVLEVAKVTWDGQTPSLRWTVFRKWARPPGPAQLARAQKRALVASKFFQECQNCWDLCNAGHMHDSRTCQGCAEELGVLH